MQSPLNIERPYIIGLTGGIASGKTTVSDLFIELFADAGVEVIDADDISRSLVKPGCPALNTIAEHYGKTLIRADGELDRSQLREIIFSNEDEKLWLENLLHPLIREKIFSLINGSSAPYLILSAPLLLESNHYDFVDRILVVDIPPSLQIERALLRDGTSREEIKKVMSSQMNRNDRLSKANDVITNDQGLKHLKEQVSKLGEQVMRYALKNHPNKLQ